MDRGLNLKIVHMVRKNRDRRGLNRSEAIDAVWKRQGDDIRVSEIGMLSALLCLEKENALEYMEMDR